MHNDTLFRGQQVQPDNSYRKGLGPYREGIPITGTLSWGMH